MLMFDKKGGGFVFSAPGFCQLA